MDRSVLITDGDQRAALACVRSLGRAGYSCFVVGPGTGGISGGSRFCRGYAASPDPLEDPAGFLEFLKVKTGEWQVEHLLPITEKSLRVVLPEKQAFQGVGIPFPDPDVFARVSDKGEVLRIAQELGIDVPRQWEWKDRGDAQTSGPPDASYPLVIKPTRSVVMGESNGLQATSAVYAHGPEDVQDWLDRTEDSCFPVLLQERVRGEGVGVFLLLWDGEVRAVVGHRRIREKPPSGGVSVLRESTAPDARLLARSVSLLDSLGWEEGVAMVEFKVDPESGRAWLMEINGRFWGSLQLAIDAGVDFPVLLLECSHGRCPSARVDGVPGVKTRWLLGDLDQVLLRLTRSRETLNLPHGMPGRASACWEFIRDFLSGTRTEVFQLSDPAPFLHEAWQWIKNLGQRNS